jgi:polyferredoxin
MVGHKVKLFRPRIIIYALLLLVLLAGTIVGIANREPLLVDVIRDKQLFRLAENGSIENVYQLRLVNKTNEARTFNVRLQESGDIVLAEAPVVIRAEPEQVLTLPITLRADAGAVKGRKDIHFVISTDGTTEDVVEESRFFGPIQ